MIAPVVVLLSLVYVVKINASSLDYRIWCQGNCDKDVAPTDTVPGLVMMGGGTDTDEAFIWQSARASGGDFVVLRTSGDDAYNPYIYDLALASGNKLNSVTTILFRNKRASGESEVLDKLRKAEAIFMAGGDQSEYVDYWGNTEVQRIMQGKVANITLGGTSAGCMVQGHYVYSAFKGSAVSDETLQDPYDKYVTIVDAFLQFPYLESIVTDTHFVTRDRMGRMVTFMARILKDATPSVPGEVRGLGVDEHTALLLDTTTGDVQAVGVGTAYLCYADHPAQVCKEDTPLTFQGLQCTRLSGKDKNKFSFKTFKGDGAAYASDVVKGKFLNLPYGPV